MVSNLSGGKKIGQCFGLFLRDETPNAAEKTPEKVEDDAKSLSFANRSGIVEDVQEPRVCPSAAEIFGYGSAKKETHDLVYVLGCGSRWNNMEIKISISSMLRFCSHWIGNIYVVGNNPGIRNPKVIHLDVPDITRTNKDANIINKI